jgi:phosphoesterase RecJ-like protein
VQIREIIKLLDERQAKLVVLLCHINADPDALGAAFAFSQLLKRLRPLLNLEIAAPYGPSLLSRFILNALPIKLTKNPNIENAEVLVMLDTNTIQQLGDWRERIMAAKAALIVIDHHASHPETQSLAALTVTDENTSSTCEIVYRLFKEADVKLMQIEAKALFLGIAFDSRHFVLASSATFKVIADLIESGVKAEENLALLSLPMHPSERIARLKASKRSKLLRINNWLIALSHVSSYQASAARAMIHLGAHIAIVAGQRDDRIQISMRSSRDFHEKTGVHLGKDVAKPLGEYLKGMGGGHSLSAGVNGIGDVEASLKHCVKLLREKLT